MVDAQQALSPASGLSRRGFLGTSAAAGVGVLLSACGVGGGGGTGGKGGGSGSISALFMKQAGYSEDDIAKMTRSFEAANPKVKVKTEFVAYEALHDKIVAAAPAGTYDVVLIDVIWPAEFGSKHIVTDVTSKWPAPWQQDMLGGAIATPEYKKKEFGVPWILDTKYFFANDADLAKAKVDPGELATWDSVMGAAKKIKAAGVQKYPLVWSWQQAEALICDYAQLLGAFGGQFTENSGALAFNKGGGVQALEFMRKSIVDGLTNPVSTQSLEDDVRRIFTAGQASMGLNWTFMYALAEDASQSKVAGHTKIMQTPSGGSARPGVNGGMALSVAAGSKNQAAAWKYITHLTSQDVQNRYAKSSLPIWKSSYDAPEVAKTNPAVVKQAKLQLNDMILRPQVEKYNAISLLLQTEIQKALLGQKDPQKALDAAADQGTNLLKS